MRFQSPCPPTRLRSCVLLALLLGVSGVAVADTIYLKNGRVIHTASAKQVGEKIEFEQFGQTVSIPASVVLRIERDERAEAPALPTASPPLAGGQAQEGDSADDVGEEPQLPPESDPDYWRDRILSIRHEQAEIQENMVALRREERAFTFSKHSTTEIRVRIEAAQARDKELDQELIDLRRDARRLGVPPGWLRVREQTTGS